MTDKFWRSKEDLNTREGSCYLTVQGTELLLLNSSGHEGTRPGLTGARNGHARPNIRFLTGRGLPVFSPN